jgi:hypothetical protein
MGGRVLCALSLIEACRQDVPILDQHRSNRDFFRTKGLMRQVQGHAHKIDITGWIRKGHTHINKRRVRMSDLRKSSCSERQKKW